MANISAVMAAATAASGANLKLTEAYNLEVLSTGIVSATVKCNQAREIAGMRRLYNSIGGFNAKPRQVVLGLVLAFRGGEVDKTVFHDTCSQATALLLSNM